MYRFSILTGVLALAVLPEHSAAQNPELLAPVQAVPAAARTWDAEERGRNMTAVRSEFVRIDAASLLALPMAGRSPLGTFGVTLFGTSHVLDIQESEMVLGYRVFEGRVRGKHGDTCIVVAPDRMTTFATIHMVDESYNLSHANSGDIHVVHDIDDGRNTLKCGCCNPPAGFNPSPAVPTTGSGGPTTPSAMATEIDVAVFYTNRAMATAGSRASMEAQAINGITKANRTNTSSAALIHFRLVLLAGVNYTENGSTQDLGRFRSTNDGVMDGVHAKRNAVGADLMHLITQPARLQYCGVGYLMNTNSTSFASSAFAVTVRSCIGGNTLAHEMGHNIACHHDPANAGRALFNHAYGFRTSDNRYRTTMSYSPGSRVEVWSSPQVTFSGYTMGNSRQDNKLTVAKTRAAVSNFRRATDIEYRTIAPGITGSKGMPGLSGVGILASNTVKPAVTFSNYRNAAPGLIVLGLNPIKIPFLGGILVPSPDYPVAITGRGNGAAITLDASGLSTGSIANIWIQTLWLDSAAVQGVSSTRGVRMLLR